ncbi:neurensin-1-like [Brienomyrus brachyistius]|uniref:neurensin-1-like n=1 Tax=Brienomyrus brachyistius TaxID=42636 RepID=UPI0020B329AC|nr:neurensin-1-like [Brienomyrus brachyistius]XP_048880087.1 neurensin-1-like [Brienomyrus brachyistius]
MGSELPCCSLLSTTPAAVNQSFGVRSYLHLFYEDCAFSRAQDDDDDDGDEVSAEEALTQGLWIWLLWRASLAVGVLLALTGSMALGVGLLLPPRIEGFGDGELLLVDERAVGHNGVLLACQLVGGVLLGLGAGVLLGCVLTRRASQPRDDARGLWDGKPHGAWPPPNVSPIHSMLPSSLSQTFGTQPKAGL